LSIEAIRRNERRKLSATFCNTLAAGLLTVGVFAPNVALVFRAENARVDSVALMGMMATVIVMASSLHYCGRYILEGLEE
jgi:hypothetical protein